MRIRMMSGGLLAGLLLVAVLASNAVAASGDLDPSFSGDGLVVTRAFPRTAVDIAVEHGGGIVSVGVGQSNFDSFGVVRFRPNGVRDTTFAGDGEANVAVPAPGGGTCYYPIAQAVALTADGEILVAGNGCGAIAVARLTHDGQLDPSFGTDGLDLTEVRALTDVTDLALGPSGTIDVAGDNRGGDVVVARYRHGGALDTGFAHDGVRVVTVPGLAHVQALALQDDGSVIVAGRTYRSPEYPLLRPFVARLLPKSGKLDPSFGTDGVAVLEVQGAFGDVVVQDGQAVAVGSIGRDVLVARFTSAGVPDDTFGPGGIRRVSFTSGCCDSAFGVTVAPSGDVIVAGCAGCSAGAKQTGIGVLAFLGTGELDPSFGEGGRTLTLGVLNQGYLRDAGPQGGVLVDSQGRIVVGTDQNADYGPAVFARYLP